VYVDVEETMPRQALASGNVNLGSCLGVEIELYQGGVNIIAEQIVNPGELMVQISQALSTSPNIRLNSLEWRMESIIDESQPEAGYGASGETIRSSYMRAVIDGRTRLTASIVGSVEATSSVRTTRDQVQGFIDSLENIPDLKVTPISMPINLDSDAALDVQLNGNARAARFELALSAEEPVSEETPP
jgi:hypothetical protein